MDLLYCRASACLAALKLALSACSHAARSVTASCGTAHCLQRKVLRKWAGAIAVDAAVDAQDPHPASHFLITLEGLAHNAAAAALALVQRLAAHQEPFLSTRR